MTDDEFNALELGDMIRHKHQAETLVITGRIGERLIATRTTIASNAHEWMLISRSRVILSAAAVAPGPAIYEVVDAHRHKTLKHGDIVRMQESENHSNYLFGLNRTVHSLQDDDGQYVRLREVL